MTNNVLHDILFYKMLLPLWFINMSSLNCVPLIIMDLGKIDWNHIWPLTMYSIKPVTPLTLIYIMKNTFLRFYLIQRNESAIDKWWSWWYWSTYPLNNGDIAHERQECRIKFWEKVISHREYTQNVKNLHASFNRKNTPWCLCLNEQLWKLRLYKIVSARTY